LLALAAGVLIMLAVLPATALAAAPPPTVERFTSLSWGTDLDACGPGDDLEVSNVIKIINKTTYDEAGNRTETTLHEVVTSTILRPDTGKSTIARSAFTIVIDDPTNDTEWAGLAVVVVVAGVPGPVTLAAGRQIYDADTGTVLFEGGPRITPAFVPALCAALA
jgi:hypothetical protein